jgi:salicylate hydroxylase
MAPALSKYWTTPACVNMQSWKGELISSMQFAESATRHGAPYWDFHRANLHRCLLDRAVELGAVVRCGAKVATLDFALDGSTTVVLQSGERVQADLVVGADGIYSKTREAFLGRVDPPQRTGDLAYRLLLKAEEMLKDPELADMVRNPQVNYWMVGHNTLPCRPS